jgi:hypothetical protein
MIVSLCRLSERGSAHFCRGFKVSSNVADSIFMVNDFGMGFVAVRICTSLKAISCLLCKISGFHGGDYEEWRLLGCYAVWLL